MATKVSKYIPLKPGNNPISGSTVTTFLPEAGYKMFEVGGDCFVFCTGIDPHTNKEVTKCSRFTAHGTMTLDCDAAALMKKLEKE